jgi:TPP-dependent pyruvate/acetoin dehydrogenase alpha subunit
VRLRTALREHGCTDEELDAVDREVDERVAAAIAFADASPEPDVSELARSVYAPGSGGQFARMRPGSPFGEEELVFDGGLGS